MNANASYDVLVIGGGASGLAAAITAARAGKSACIVERDVACGLKLLATGNGRCNLPTNQLISSGTTAPHSSNPSWVPSPSKSSAVSSPRWAS
ncbi:MAG: NAD(P)/FAD-dependent oxidoreductase [Collinsella sp.]